jgi:hypothetical protein
MENPQDLCNIEGDGDARKATVFTSPTSSGSSGGPDYRLFGRQASVHQCMGGGKGKKKKKKKKKRLLTHFIL